MNARGTGRLPHLDRWIEQDHEHWRVVLHFAHPFVWRPGVLADGRSAIESRPAVGNYEPDVHLKDG